MQVYYIKLWMGEGQSLRTFYGDVLEPFRDQIQFNFFFVFKHDTHSFDQRVYRIQYQLCVCFCFYIKSSSCAVQIRHSQMRMKTLSPSPQFYTHWFNVWIKLSESQQILLIQTGSMNGSKRSRYTDRINERLKEIQIYRQDQCFAHRGLDELYEEVD